MRWLKYIAYTIITIVIALLIVLMLIATTNTGLRWGFSIIRHALPGELQIGEIKGRLMGPLTLQDISYRNDSMSVNVTHVYLEGSLLPLIFKDLDLKTLIVEGVRYQQLATSKKKSEPFQWNGLPIKVNIPNVDIKDIAIAQQDENDATRINEIKLGIATSGQTVTVKQFNFVAPNYHATADGKVLAIAPFSTQLNAEVSGKLNQEQYTDISAKIYGDAKKLHIVGQSKQPFKSDLNVVLMNLLGKPSINANMNWQHLTWVINGFSSIAIQKGQANITGPINNYQFSANTDISGSKIPAGTWSVNGNGNYDGVQIKQLLAKTLGGSLQAQANFSWKNKLTWQANISGENINPGLEWQNWQANLNFASKLSGSYDSQQQHLSNHIILSQLSGNLHKYNLTGQADVNLQNQNLYIKQLNVKLGENKLHASGELSKTWNINWQATLPELNAIWQNGGGQLESKGSITGSKQAPIIKAYAKGSKIALPWLSLDRITANIDLGARPTDPANVQGEIDNLQINQHTIKQVKLMSQGTITKQQITGSLTLPNSTINTELDGGIIDAKQEKTWQGVLQKFNINTDEFGNWALKQAAPLSLNAKSASLASTCLANDSGSICGGVDWQSQQRLAAKLKSQGLNLSMINHLLPNNLKLDAPINVDINIDSNFNGKQSGRSVIDIPNGKIDYTYKGQTQTFTLNNSSMISELSNTGLNTQVNISTNPDQTLTGNINLPNFILVKGWNPDQRFEGQLNVNAPDLSWLATLVGPLEKTKGSLVGELDLAGTLQQPQLKGHIDLQNGSTFIAPLDITPSNINLKASFDPNKGIVYKGSLASDQGKLNLSGQTELNEFFNTTLNITGKNILGINTAEYKAHLSPDLKLTYNKPKLTLSGSLNVDKATLKPKSFASTTTLPDNIVYIRDEKMTDKPLQFYLDLNLGLKNVNFAYQGLKAELEGELNLHLEPESSMTATGELRTVSGSYKAYNQDLSIQKGSIIYTGGPIGNPGIDITATRTIQTVFDTSGVQQTLTVGVNLTGTIKHPQLNLFSSPVTLNQTDILSYIVLGHGTNTASGGQGQLLIAAASSMGLTDNKLTQGIQKTFGLSELGLESDEVMNQAGSLQSNTSLVIGKKITPKFSIRYSAGLLVPVDVFKMMYQLSRRWSVQTDNSQYDNGADLIYTIESG
jgi:translocation and assembly module TamB